MLGRNSTSSRLIAVREGKYARVEIGRESTMKFMTSGLCAERILGGSMHRMKRWRHGLVFSARIALRIDTLGKL